MPVIIPCVKCHRKLRVLDRLLGKLVKCPACQTKFVASNGTARDLPAVGRPGSASGLNRPAASKSQPPSRRVQATPPPSKSPMVRPMPPRTAPASSPSQEMTVEQGEEDFMAGPAPALRQPPPQLNQGGPASSISARRRVQRPPQTPFVRVFVTLGGVLLATAVVGLLCAFWVNSSVQSLSGRFKDEPRPNKVK